MMAVSEERKQWGGVLLEAIRGQAESIINTTVAPVSLECPTIWSQRPRCLHLHSICMKLKMEFEITVLTEPSAMKVGLSAGSLCLCKRCNISKLTVFSEVLASFHGNKTRMHCTYCFLNTYN